MLRARTEKERRRVNYHLQSNVSNPVPGGITVVWLRIGTGGELL
jgi:hypothetical protein